jgi:hypothetical protein
MFALLEGERGLRSKKPNSQSSSQRINETSTREIYFRIFSAQGKRSWESDGILRTDFGAGLALNALREIGLPRILRNGSHGTLLLAFQTFIAILTNPALEKPQGRDEAQKSSQWAKVTAPETWNQPIKENDPSENQKRDSRHIINRLKIVEVR